MSVTTVQSIATGLIFGSYIGMHLILRRQRALSKLGLRREAALCGIIDTLAQAMNEPDASQEDVLHAWEKSMVNLGDELHNQQRVFEHYRPWMRVPPPNKPWPNFEPAPIVTRDE